MDGNNMPGQQPVNEFSQSTYLQPQNNMGQNPYQQPQNNMGQNPYQQPQNNMGQNPYQQPQTDYSQFQQQGAYQPIQPGYQGGYDQGGYQNNGYEQQNYYQPPQQQPTPGFSIASMVCGILSLVLFCCLWKYDLVLSIPAIALGVIGLKKEENGKGMAVAGIICGAIGLLLGISFIIVSIAIANRIRSMGAAGMEQLIREMLEEALRN